MKKIIKGEMYNFVVNCFKCENDFLFYIEAINLQEKTHSFINNLNNILSEFNINMNDKRISESQWILKRKEAKLFFSHAINFLLDIKFKNYIERRLNEDRSLGEWNKI